MDLKQFYTPKKVTSFAPLFSWLKRAGGELNLALNVFHYGMLNHTLISAVNKSKPDVVRFLLEHNPPVIFQTLEWLSVIAARTGCLEVIRQLPVTARGLEAAVFEGHLEAAKYLLPFQACDYLMETACQGGHLDMVLFLQGEGYRVTDVSICAAVEYNRLELVRVFTEQQPCPLTAMYRAVSSGHYEITAFLLPQFMDELSFLLITAACTPHLNIVQLLVENGAYIESWLIKYVRERGFPQNANYLEAHHGH